MAVDLKIGENVSVPPAGYKRLKVNADGTGALLDPDGTESEIGGQVPTTFVSAEINLAADNGRRNPRRRRDGEGVLTCRCC